MQAVLLVLAATVGGGEIDSNVAAYPETIGMLAQAQPSPFRPYTDSDAIDDQRRELDSAIRSSVRPAVAQSLPPQTHRNPIRSAGFDDAYTGSGVQAVQFQQDSLFPSRGVDGLVGGQGRNAATDPTAGTGQRLQPVPPKNPGYGSLGPHNTRKLSPLMQDTSDDFGAGAGGGSIYGSNSLEDSSKMERGIYSPPGVGASGANPGMSKKTPAYLPPTMARPNSAAKETSGQDLSIMFPEEGDSEFKGYHPPPRMTPSDLDRVSSSNQAKNKPVYGSSATLGQQGKYTGYGDPIPTPLVPATSRQGVVAKTPPPKTTPQAVHPKRQRPMVTSTQPPAHTSPMYNPPLPTAKHFADSTFPATDRSKQNVSKVFAPVPIATTTPAVGGFDNRNQNREINSRLRTGGSYFMTLLALFASVGLNFYLGWIAWDTYNRYQDVVADMRYNGSRRERGERRLAESSF